MAHPKAGKPREGAPVKLLAADSRGARLRSREPPLSDARGALRENRSPRARRTRSTGPITTRTRWGPGLEPAHRLLRAALRARPDIVQAKLDTAAIEEDLVRGRRAAREHRPGLHGLLQDRSRLVQGGPAEDLSRRGASTRIPFSSSSRGNTGRSRGPFPTSSRAYTGRISGRSAPSTRKRGGKKVRKAADYLLTPPRDYGTIYTENLTLSAGILPTPRG